MYHYFEQPVLLADIMEMEEVKPGDTVVILPPLASLVYEESNIPDYSLWLDVPEGTIDMLLTEDEIDTFIEFGEDDEF